MSSPWGAGAGERRKWEGGRAVEGTGLEAAGWRGDGEGVTAVRVAAGIRLPVPRGRWARLGPPGATGSACLPGSRGCESSPGPEARLGCAPALPARRHSHCHMCCVCFRAERECGPTGGHPCRQGLLLGAYRQWWLWRQAFVPVSLPQEAVKAKTHQSAHFNDG